MKFHSLITIAAIIVLSSDIQVSAQQSDKTISNDQLKKANDLLKSCGTKSLEDCINKVNQCASEDAPCRCDKLPDVSKCYQQSSSFDSKKCKQGDFQAAADVRGTAQKQLCDQLLKTNSTMNRTNTTNTTNSPEIKKPNNDAQSKSSASVVFSAFISAAALFLV
jgi:hypothetical protein